MYLSVKKKAGGDREEEKKRDHKKKVFKDYVSQQTEVNSDLSDLREKMVNKNQKITEIETILEETKIEKIITETIQGNMVIRKSQKMKI